MTFDDWRTGLRTRYEEQKRNGMHDDRCEWRPNGHFICNCRKRKRIASGFTELPGDLYFPPPSCPRCSADVDFDGDSWICHHCGVAWHSDGSDARFTDDMGDDEDLAISAAEYDARATEFHPHTDRRSPKETEIA